MSKRSTHLRRPGGVSLCAILLLTFTGAAALGAAAGPRATLQRLNGSVDRQLRKKLPAGSPEEGKVKDEVKQLAAELLDYGELTKRALGEHWDKLTPKQRADFVATLKDLIERNYVKQIRTNLDYEVSYGEEKLAGDEARVSSTVKVKTKGKVTEALIEYRMIRRDGRWMVYDVITDELSLVRNYRSQFQRIIGQAGYDGLLQRMKKKLQEAQEEKG
jgi:phospholipid transport system substrate-binding protein